MMKISFEIIRHHCFVLATTINLNACVCFYVNIRLHKKKALYNKTLRSLLNIERNKNLQSKKKKVFNHNNSQNL